MERGEWQKKFVSELVEKGFSYEHAMMAMGLACEERQKAYMQGYEKGYDDYDKNKKVDKV